MRPHPARRTTALFCSAALAAALSAGGCANGPQPATGPATSARPAAATAVVAPSRSIPGLPGTLYYLRETDEGADRLVRVTPGGNRTVVSGDRAVYARVSPDGTGLVWVTDGALTVADADGRNPRKLLDNVAAGYGFDPVWSGDSTTLLTGVVPPGADVTSDESTLVAVRVADGRVTPMPKALAGNLSYQWSGDGREVFFAGGECTVGHAHADGTARRTVPVLGSTDAAENPTVMRSCDVVGVNRDGSRIAVDLHVGDEPDGDITASTTADAVIDTATGALVRLPVRGTVRAAVFGPDGTLLVRSEAAGARTLTLIDAGGAVLATVAEPTALKDDDLRDYVR
jgi:TolB protein